MKPYRGTIHFSACSAIIGLLLLFSNIGNIQAQGINVKFGQNRVQYHDFKWSFYESDNFVTYFYLGGQDIGSFVAQIAEKDLPDIENILDYKINNKIELLVYNDVTDLNQSNIGQGLELNNTGGITKIIGNKVFIYFNGDHNDLRRQVREGITEVLISNMIFGGNFQEILQNAVLLNLPEWFVNGLVSYVGQSWSAEYDARLKDGILSGKFKKYNKLTGEDAKLAGHSFWYFIQEKNGKEAISNLLYLIRINRSMENAFLFVLGYIYVDAIDAWYEYFYKRYSEEEFGREQTDPEKALDTKYYKNRVYNQARLRPDGKMLAYVTNDLGKWRIHLVDLVSNKKQIILKGGFKTRSLTNDLTYPLINWDPTGRKLAVFYEKRDNIKLMLYNSASGNKEFRDIVRFQRINSFSFTDNAKIIVMSATNKGQSDIYTFDTRSKSFKQLTNDPYDDKQPVPVDFGDRKGFVFSSNRTSETNIKSNLDREFPVGDFDLFFMPEGQPEKLLNLTNTPNYNEDYPQQADNRHFAFLSDENGIINRYAGYIDTVFSHFETTVYYKDSIKQYRNIDVAKLRAEYGQVIDSLETEKIYKDTAYYFAITNLSRGLLEQDILLKKRKVLDLVYYDRKYHFFINPMPDSLNIENGLVLEDNTYRESENKFIHREKIDDNQKQKEKGIIFQSEYDESDTTFHYNLLNNKEEKSYKPTKVRPYRLKFSSEYVLSQLDNTLVIDQYQNFVGNGPVFVNQPLGGLISMSISDLFENHRFTGGFRFPFTFDGSEYLFKYENLKKRLDISYLYYRKSIRAAYSFVPDWFREVSAKQRTNYAEVKVSYPFDVMRSLRLSGAVKNYRLNFLSRDTFSLALDPYIENWFISRLEYVFDNTYQVGLNILNGTRYKIYYEIQNQFDAQIDPKFKFDPFLGMINVIGGDFRHYMKVHRQIVWANRFAFASSFGSKKIIYYMGGVDNWLAPRFDDAVEVNMENNYAFQTIATNMRGHLQNIRNGSSYAVINSELRIPVFTYLFNTPIRSELIKNFQLIGFGDIGTAWEGSTPFSSDNPFNTETVERGPVKIVTQYFRNPIVGGFGGGIRTMIFGYFFRVDLAWGVDSGEVNQKPIWYFSLNTDF
jgi:hypothetical protein